MTHFGRVMEALTDQSETWWDARYGRMKFSGRQIYCFEQDGPAAFFELSSQEALEVLETRELIPPSANRRFVCGMCSDGIRLREDGKPRTCNICGGKVVRPLPSTGMELISFAVQPYPTIVRAEALVGEYVGNPNVPKIWKISAFKSNAGKYSPKELKILKELRGMEIGLRYHDQFTPALTIRNKFT